MFSTFTILKNLLDPKIIGVFLISTSLIWFYFTYDVIKKEQVKITKIEISKLKESIQDKEIQIRNLKVDIEELKSEISTFKFGSEVDQYLQELGGNEYAPVSPIDSNHLPF